MQGDLLPFIMRNKKSTVREVRDHGVRECAAGKHQSGSQNSVRLKIIAAVPGELSGVLTGLC